jgi:hypothetical protein
LVASLQQPSAAEGTYPGKLTPETTPSLYNTSLAGLEAWATNLANPQGMNKTAEGTLTSAMTKKPGTEWQDYYTKAIETPALEDFSSKVLPKIGRTTTGTGNFWSTERTRTEDVARKELLNQLTQQRAATGYQSFESDLNRQLQAAGLVPQVGQAQGQEMLMALTGGQTQYKQQIADLQAQYQEWLRQQSAVQARQSAMLQALGVQTTGQIITPSAGGLIGPLVSAAGNILGSYAKTNEGASTISGLFGKNTGSSTVSTAGAGASAYQGANALAEYYSYYGGF